MVFDVLLGGFRVEVADEDGALRASFHVTVGFVFGVDGAHDGLVVGIGVRAVDRADFYRIVGFCVS